MYGLYLLINFVCFSRLNQFPAQSPWAFFFLFSQQNAIRCDRTRDEKCLSVVNLTLLCFCHCLDKENGPRRQETLRIHRATKTLRLILAKPSLESWLISRHLVVLWFPGRFVIPLPQQRLMVSVFINLLINLFFLPSILSRILVHQWQTLYFLGTFVCFSLFSLTN